MILNKLTNFELLVEKTNNKYIELDKAFIEKRIPLEITKKNGYKITGFLNNNMINSYFGSYKGLSFYFNVKMNKNISNLSLYSFNETEIEIVRKEIKHGTYVFFIINFSKLEKTFFVPANFILEYWDDFE